LAITVVGMGLVFLALGIVFLAMIVLQRVFSPPPAPAVEAPAAGRSAEKIAAIGLALARALAEERSSISPAGPSSAWAAAGRSRALNRPRSRETKR